MEKKDIKGKIEEDKAKLQAAKTNVEDEAKAKLKSARAKAEESAKAKPFESKIRGAEASKPRTNASEEKAGETKKTKKRGLGFYLIFAAAFIGLGMLISFISAIAIQKTSGVQFCSSCHSMKPMADAYRNSLHGGFGEKGVVAKCADCHLPHESLIGYLIQKGKSGMWDLWVETTHDTSKIDWFERREDKRHFVYDSGCLHCHENLLKATKLKSKPFIAHKAYFSNKLKVKDDKKWKKAQCVDCHRYVGHYQLGKHLPKIEETSDELSEE